jgi:glutamate mutase epsilon subunit
VQAVNDAKIAQRDSNNALLAGLIDVGQGVNRAAQSQLGSAAADATARRNAYTQARAQSKANTYSTIGSLASAAILAFTI